MRAIEIDVDRPVRTAAGTLATTPLVLIDLRTREGITGRSYLRCYSSRALKPLADLVASLTDLITGEPADPTHLASLLRREFALLGLHGLTGLALAGIDMCAWDAQAQASELPLNLLLGGATRGVPAYASIRSMEPVAAAVLALEAADAGYRAVKVKLGPSAQDDRFRTVHAVRAAIGDGIGIMVDFNQSLTRAQALRILPGLTDLNVLWIEEPISSDDVPGNAHLAASTTTPIALGENAWGPESIRSMLAANACSQLVLDVTRIGGISGWLSTAALPEGAGVPIANHTFPEVSVHLLASARAETPVWLESIDHAGPILQNPFVITNGMAQPTDRVGNGISWDETAVRRWHR